MKSRRRKTYAEREYGVTPEQLAAFIKKLKAEGDRDRRAGRMKVYKGDIEALLKTTRT